jgi:hypothetical protein
MNNSASSLVTGRLANQASDFRNPDTPQDIELLLQLGLGHAGSVKHFDTKRKFNSSKNWLANPHRSAKRQRWINRLEEIGYLDPPGVGEMSI